MRYFELCDKSVAVANEIIAGEEFQELLLLKDKIANSIPDLLENFKKAKEKYEEASKYSTYHPDLKKYRIELSKAKEELYTNELVIRYKELEKIIQEKLKMVANEIAKAISDNTR
jgi:cell fate (sporulation/competence/biofilm development) regulator YlbF (YheA/YmcA/DUF963 family)